MIAKRIDLGAFRQAAPRAALALACALAASHAQAQPSQPPLRVGQKPSAAQIEQFGSLRRVEIDGRSYQLLASIKGADQRPASRLLGPDGVVGQSFHEVVISDQPTADVRARLATLISKALTVRYYDAGDISILRFSDIHQAAAALAPIRAALPTATVGLPIIVNVDKPQ